jgi:hypothetical protein
MRVLTGAIAALALAGSTAANAQVVYRAEPGPVYVNPTPYYAPAPVVVAPAPRYVAPGYDYAYVPEPYTGSTVVDYRTGRSCTIEPSGYRWCWTP